MIGVVDASVALSWILLDEHTPASDAFFARVANEGALVPALWRLEVASALQNGIRRKRIEATYRDIAIQKLARLPVAIDPETNVFAWTATLHLADIHGITVYDAAYLELAIRRRLPLATRDVELIAAAGNAGVILLPA